MERLYNLIKLEDYPHVAYICVTGACIYARWDNYFQNLYKAGTSAYYDPINAPPVLLRNLDHQPQVTIIDKAISNKIDHKDSNNFMLDTIR